MKPVIGITGRRAGAGADFPETLSHLKCDVYITAYAERVAQAGAIPVWIGRLADADDLAQRLDGFVIAGGQDVDPRLYGRVPSATSTVLDPERDAFESALVRAAVGRDRPVLGICRGAQIINVAFGGTLHDDHPIGIGESHSFYGYPAGHRSHLIDIAPGSALAGLYGAKAAVNSYHHQSVDSLGAELVATAHAPDGVVEAIELAGADLLGVQWHPEMLDEMDPVFDWLVATSSPANHTHNQSESNCAYA